MKQILIVDDEIEMLDSLKKLFLHKPEFKIRLINEPFYAKTVIQQEVFDLLITDLKMKAVSGIELLKLSKKYHPDCPVILISGYGTIESSVEAMKSGATDFIEKPFSSQKLFDCIDKAILKSKSRVDRLSISKKRIPELTGLIYKSKKMQSIVEKIENTVLSNTNVLITGEHGSGKEMIARFIHQFSKSSMDPFVPVHCGALPESLFEIELFGNEKEDIDKSIRTKPGLLEFAGNGTVFLDGIEKLTHHLQAKLLQMISEGKIKRVGGRNEIGVNARIIAATNIDLSENINSRLFNNEFLNKLKYLHIHVPPLRERKEDILLFADHFLQEICKEKGDTTKTLTQEAGNKLEDYAWPGNIRELHNVISRAYYLSPDEIINEKDLPIHIPSEEEKIKSNAHIKNYAEAKELLLERFEVEYLTHHLKIYSGNVSKTADECGMDRRTIHRLIKKYNIIYKDSH